jgi:hypothetical protein
MNSNTFPFTYDMAIATFKYFFYFILLNQIIIQAKNYFKAKIFGEVNQKILQA